MITNITVVRHKPSRGGKECPGNGLHRNKNVREAECGCDECDYFLKYFPEHDVPLSKNRAKLKVLPLI